MKSRSGGEAALVAALLTLLAALIVYPLLQVLSVAFLDGGWPTLRPLLAFFARPVFREAQRFVGGPWTAGQHRQRGFVPL